MKNLLFLFYLILLMLALNSSCKGTDSGTVNEIILSNPSDLVLKDQPVSIDRKFIFPTDSVAPNPVLLFGTDTLALQTNDLDRDGVWDELFLVADFEPNEKKTLQLSWSASPLDHKVRTSVRFGKRKSSDSPIIPAKQETFDANKLPINLGYQAYQTDGPSWENDKVGFRHYLDGRNSKDVFGKTTSDMSPENVGIDENGSVVDNYHAMEDWGRDILSVGNSVGLGGYVLDTSNGLLRLGTVLGDSINNIGKTTFQILEEGPVNSVLEYKYENWRPTDERTYNVVEKTSIWPGIYGYKNEVVIGNLQGDENLLVGLVNIHNDSPIQVLDANKDFIAIYTHDKQSYEKQWWLGMAIIVPKGDYLGYTEAPKSGIISNSFFAKIKIKDNEPTSYYAIAGWELSDSRFVDGSYFKEYLEDLIEQLTVHIAIEYNIVEPEGFIK